jgi:hypothetical protein
MKSINWPVVVAVVIGGLILTYLIGPIVGPMLSGLVSKFTPAPTV